MSERGSVWPLVEIGDVAEVVGGGTPSTRNAGNFDGDVPWLTPKDLSGSPARVVARGGRNLSRAGLANSSARLVPPGAVLLSTRAPIGYVAIAGGEVSTNQGFRNLLPRGAVRSDFLYYWLKANTEVLERHAVGTTFRELPGSVLKRIRIPLPPLSEQRAVARVLGALDDRIEANRRMNATLEGMAQAVFKDWFVDFGPVRAKAAGRAPWLPGPLWSLFPDRLVDSGLGEIPEGWEVGCLGAVAAASRRGADPVSLDDDTPYIGLEHMPRRSIALTDWERVGKVTSNKTVFAKGDILFGKLRPYFHKVGIAPTNGVCSTDILVIVPKAAEWAAFVTASVSSVRFVDHADRTSTGTKMPRTSWKTMSGYRLCLPETSVVRAFQDAVQPALERIVVNVHESRALAGLRDTLLPRLVSGKLRVRGAE